MTDYYTAPSQEIFDELKRASINLWNTYDDTYGYSVEKIKRIRDIENIKDNFMFMFAMFDVYNQRKILDKVSPECAAEIAMRLR